jgi:hypothetical protein
MAPASLLWKLFHKDGSKYLNNKTHKNAWCEGCLKAKMQERRDSDSLAFIQLGESDPASLSETALKAEGESYFQIQLND